jgi:hypothetical protein
MQLFITPTVIKKSHLPTDNLYAIKLSIPSVQYKLGHKIPKFYICGSSEWNLLDVTLLLPRILRLLFFFFLFFIKFKLKKFM